MDPHNWPPDFAEDIGHNWCNVWRSVSTKKLTVGFVTRGELALLHILLMLTHRSKNTIFHTVDPEIVAFLWQGSCS
jgi:hypothetical protein